MQRVTGTVDNHIELSQIELKATEIVCLHAPATQHLMECGEAHVITLEKLSLPCQHHETRPACSNLSMRL